MCSTRFHSRNSARSRFRWFGNGMGLAKRRSLAGKSGVRHPVSESVQSDAKTSPTTVTTAVQFRYRNGTYMRTSSQGSIRPAPFREYTKSRNGNGWRAEGTLVAGASQSHRIEHSRLKSMVYRTSHWYKHLYTYQKSKVRYPISPFQMSDICNIFNPKSASWSKHTADRERIS